MSQPFSPMTEVSSFRRIAAGMWRNPSDPSIYGSMDVDATAALRFIETFRAKTGKRLTITHVVARAVAQAFARHPDLNAKVRFWGRLEQRSAVDLFVSVSTEGGKDLSGVRIPGAEGLSLEALIDSVEQSARSIRAGSDATYKKSRDVFKALPWWCTRPLLWLTDLLTNEFHLHLPKHGLPRDPFGTALITNVGTFGIDTAFAPFVPMARCPMLLLVTEVKPRPVAVGDRVEVRPILRLCATFDHRVIDGYHAGLLAKDLRAFIEDPALDEAATSQPSLALAG